MSSTLDDDDLALSINPSYSRRGSARGPEAGGGAADNQQQSRQSAPPTERQMQKAMQQRLGQYQILSTLGEGSFGKVKLAVHQVTGQKVALKIISRRKLVARDMAGRIEREIQYLQLLRHPHIIKLYTVITTPAEIIMVLEFAGSELFNYIVDHGRMQEDKARKFFQQIVCAVEYCHRHKIVHRDLKPENLLLDHNLHVKIADFGLSNIMTDGNFLKTSCGSPNYAAPEVISGKLYAGPEVDVWSCGVILYVLLVGRLPFDDEYIPALFKKIQAGNYAVPHYLSPEAADLIHKMLQVDPVKRLTVQELRQAPWFTKDLPAYLQPPVEEFLDTGVDPNRAIDPHNLAPNQPLDIQEKIHDSVVGKLGKTMGYGKDDVQQALAIDEPNAIKDAYLIVRENQIMKETPSLATDPNFQPFLAQSPPTYATSSPIASLTGQTQAYHGTVPTYSTPGHPERPRNGSAAPGSIESRSPVNTIAVLPSSLPDYHQAWMKGQPPQLPTSAEGSDHGSAKGSPGEPQPKQSAEKQAMTAKRLKPHSRSQVNLERMQQRPDGMTPVSGTTKRPKATRWQFGIRSRNQPAEAMLAIYKALKAMGAEWEVPRVRRPRAHRDGRYGEGRSLSSSGDDSSSDDDNNEQQQQHHSQQHNYDNDHSHHSNRDSAGDLSDSSDSSDSRGRHRDRRGRSHRYSSANDWGYKVPVDPWIINVRFRKDGMYPPRAMTSTSTHSSRADLNGSFSAGGGGGARGSDLALARGPPSRSGSGSDGDTHSRRSSLIGSVGSGGGGGGTTSTTNTPPLSNSTTASGGATTTLDNTSMTGPAPALPQSHSQPQSRKTSDPTSNPSSRPTSRKTSFTQLLQGNSANNSTSSVLGSAGGGTNNSLYGGVEADNSAFVYMTVQLYSIEKEFFLVDFKSAGYERLVKMVRPGGGAGLGKAGSVKSEGPKDGEDVVGTGKEAKAGLQEEGEGGHAVDDDDEQDQGGDEDGDDSNENQQLVGDGRALEEKDVSSPFPFLDEASRLIIQLAEAE